MPIDLKQLQAELQSARGAFDKWALDTVSAADQLRDSHRRNIADLRGTAHANDAIYVLHGLLKVKAGSRGHRDTTAAPTGTKLRGR